MSEIFAGGERVGHWSVRGRVQGVWFRASTRDRARELGVVGWVRNAEDGSVEVAVRGPAGAVQALREYVGQGPRHARVETVEELEPVEGPTDWDDFTIHH